MDRQRMDGYNCYRRHTHSLNSLREDPSVVALLAVKGSSTANRLIVDLLGSLVASRSFFGIL